MVSLVRFELRTDTKNYKNTNLINWQNEIGRAITEFNGKISRLTDRAKIELIEIKEKYFTIQVDIDKRFGPTERSFYTRIGSISRFLKEYGMGCILSPHGKLFTLKVESSDDSCNTSIDKKKEFDNKHNKQIFVDYSKKFILIPKEMMDQYSIKFY